METYLRSQWAGMMHAFLNRDAEQTRVQDSLQVLAQVNKNIAALSARILSAVGTPIDKVAVQFLDRMLQSQVVSDLRYVGAQPSPGAILKYETFDDATVELAGIQWDVSDEDFSGVMISGGGEISSARHEASSLEYVDLRQFMLDRLEEERISVDDYLQYENETAIGKVLPLPEKVASGRNTGAEKIPWKTGDRAIHRRWGAGTIVSVMGAGDKLELVIRFDRPVGDKHFLAALTPVIRVPEEE